MVNSASNFPGPLGLEIAIVHALVAVEAQKVDRKRFPFHKSVFILKSSEEEETDRSVFVLQEKEEVCCVRDCESAFLYHKSEMKLTSKCIRIPSKKSKNLKKQKMCLKKFGLRPDFD